MRRLDARIQALAADPRPPRGEKLEGSDDLHRIRPGDDRAVYRVDEDRRVVLIVAVGHRKDVYRP